MLANLTPLPLEQNQLIAHYEHKIAQLLQAIGSAPLEGWIECGKKRKDFYQAFWRSRKPIFNGKTHLYIGKKGGIKHQKALEICALRKELNRAQKQLKQLQFQDKKGKIKQRRKVAA
jgi:hypothetical protein